MKLFRQIALSAFVTLSAFAAITYTSCSKDACSGVTCNNGGTCSGGNCTCTTGYKGVHCDTTWNMAIIASYNITETCTPPVSGNTYNSTITASSTTPGSAFIISNFGNSGASATGTIDANGNITIPSQTISGQTLTVSQATLTGNVLTITYTIPGYTCTMTMTKQ
jgi:hypothetical protein